MIEFYLEINKNKQNKHDRINSSCWDERALHLAREEYIGDICETTLSPLSDEDVRVLRAMAADEKESSIKDDFLTKSGEEFYDVVIDIDSINALKYKGWEIKY